MARVLDEAVRRQRVVVLRYTDRTGCRPNGPWSRWRSAATGGYWHLLAWCRLRQGPRWFRTDRITAAHLTAEPAPEHDAATLFGTPPADARPVRLADRCVGETRRGHSTDDPTDEEGKPCRGSTGARRP